MESNICNIVVEILLTIAAGIERGQLGGGLPGGGNWEGSKWGWGGQSSAKKCLHFVSLPKDTE